MSLWAFLISHMGITEPSSCFGAAPPLQANGPVDIQANEQEFASDHVIARGNVHVKYKDSVVIAPQATLYRDSAGNPQKAIFTGHPRLVQGQNKIDADVLIFEISDQRVIAEGNAHSEVVGNEADDITKQEKTNGIRRSENPSQREHLASGVTDRIESTETERQGESAKEKDDFAKPQLIDQKRTGEKSQPTEKIITDSDRQEYQRSSGKFDAVGHVRVKHGDISVRADKLQLVYGIDNKPETAVFTGNVSAMQNQNQTQADKLTYFLTTKRLQATGHVRSKVIQEKKPSTAKKTKPIAQSGMLFPGAAVAANTLSTSEPSAQTATSEATDDPIEIVSDAQDYSSENGRVSAEGNVRVYYQDTVGMGPKVILLRDSLGKAEKVLFIGRSQISQPGKRWIADRITLKVEDKKVLAQGNTKAFILQAPDKGKPSAPYTSSTKLAGRPRETRETGKISATKIEVTR